MDKAIIITLVEFLASTIVEGIVLAFIFQRISDKTQQNSELLLKDEMNNIEKQNKYTFDQIQTNIQNSKLEIISQIKESEKKKPTE